MLRQPTILLISFLFSLQTKAQLYPFVNYTPRDGLIGNQVRFITQDHKGKLYFGTTNGLSIYDGWRFSNYSTENGLTTNLINGILEAGDSVFVVENTHNIQYIYNGRVKNVFLKDSFCPVINQLIRCRDGHYFAVADEGLFRFEKDHFSRIVLNGLTDINADRNLAHVTEFDSLLVINMELFNPAYKAPKRFIVYNYHTGNVLTDTLFPDVYYSVATTRNELLLSTAKGILALDLNLLRSGIFKLIPTSYQVPSTVITDRMYVDRQQNLWINRAEAILKVSPGGSSKLFSRENGVIDGVASCIFQDREGIMWFGSNIAGAMKLVDQGLEFYKEFRPGFFPYDIYIQKGTDSVWMYDQAHHRLLLDHHQLVSEFPVVGKDALYRIVMGKKRCFGLAPYTVYQLQPAANNSFVPVPVYTNSTAKESFSCLLIDENDNPIVIGSNSVIAVLPGRKIISESLNYFVDKAVLTADNFLFIVTRAMNIYIYKINPSDPDNYLRLVNKYDWQNRNVEPRSFDIDGSGRLWMGTRQRGLVCYSIRNGDLKFLQQLTAKDGLTENFVKYVYCDNKGNVWASTPTGLDKVSFEDKGVQIENVTKAANMYVDVWKTEGDRRGVIWALATSGLVKIYPSDKPSTPVAPGIILSKFAINNRELPFPQQKLNLKYFENNLFFRVAVPSFFDEKKTLFSYRLDAEGKTGTWTELSSSPEFSFLNLSPGHYDLKVKSVFLNGKYAPLEAGYSFTIMFPWWQTWWFIGIEFLSFLAVMTIFFRLYYRNKLNKQLIGLEKKRAVEKERTRIATDMHDDMGAGLSRIKVLSETIKFENQKGILDPGHLQKISSYSEEMMDKMGEIVWALNQQNDSMNDLLGYTRAYAMDYLTTHDIHCSFHAPVEHPEIFASGEMRRNIFLSVKEVLHNVVKHAGATSVDITITIGRDLSILIHDNGKGINLEKLRKFGNGLNNIRKRMVEIGGTAKFKSENGTLVMLQVSLEEFRTTD